MFRRTPARSPRSYYCKLEAHEELKSSFCFSRLNRRAGTERKARQREGGKVWTRQRIPKHFFCLQQDCVVRSLPFTDPARVCVCLYVCVRVCKMCVCVCVRSGGHHYKCVANPTCIFMCPESFLGPHVLRRIHVGRRVGICSF